MRRQAAIWDMHSRCVVVPRACNDREQPAFLSFLVCLRSIAIPFPAPAMSDTDAWGDTEVPPLFTGADPVDRQINCRPL